MNQRSFINLLLAFLWCIASICGFLVLSWLMHLEWIDSLHEWTTERVINEPSRIYGHIVRQQRLDPDPGRTTDALEDLADRLASVQKNDVLDPVKRNVLSQLVWLYQQQNDLHSALRWAKYWRSYDPWDLNAQIEWASIMMTSADTYGEGKATFEILTRRFPELLGVTTSYARALAKSGHFGEAFLLFSPFLQESSEHPFVKPIGRLPDLDWDVRLLNNSESMPRTSRNWATSESDWTLNIQAGTEVDKVVFLIPVASIVYVHSVSLIQNGIRHKVPFSEMEYEGFIDNVDRLWKSDSSAATLAIFPAKPSTGDFKVVVELSIAPSDVLIKLIQPPIGSMTLSQLESSDADSAAMFHYAQSMLDLWTVHE